MSEASTRRTPVTDEPRSTIEYSSSLSLNPAVLRDRGEGTDVRVTDHRAGSR
ncbi:hypothetical protein SALBM311S_05771 [Streptomyces alboniger]